MDEVRIVYTPIFELKGWKRNPKLHDRASIRASLKRFGFVSPIVMDEKSGRLVAGHGRLECCIEMFRANEPAPRRVQVKDGTWLVPVLRGADFKTEAEAEAYLVADNYIGEIGGWNNAELTEMLKDIDLEGTGMDPLEMERIRKDVEATFVETTKAANQALEESEPEPVPEKALPRRWGAAPDAVTLSIGRYRFDVPKAKHDAWEEDIRTKVGFEKANIVEEIKRRLGLA